MLFHHYFWAVDVILYRDGETLKQARTTYWLKPVPACRGFYSDAGNLQIH